MVTIKGLIICHIIYIIGNFRICSSKVLNDSKIPSPIILVPGDGGSRAYSMVDYRLFTTKVLVWVNFEYMLFPTFLKNVFQLEYNPNTHNTSNMKGSDVFFPGWGDTDTIEELDERLHVQTTYFSNLVSNLVTDKFYVRNKTVRGAPYDFRKAPNENQEMIKKMKLLVEDTYRHSGNQRVVILGHSLGSLYTIYFLKKMTISWKKQHIRAFLSVCGPLGGAVKAVSLETSGASLGSPRNPIYFRDMQRSFPSTAFLLPKPEIFGKEALVITPKRNYSAYDYEDFFRDMSMKYGPMMYNDTKDLVNGIETPEGIDELYCIHSYGLPTAKQLIFKSFPDGEPEIINGDGDYTVNIDSLKICKNWKNVNYITIKNADHMQIVSTAEFLLKLKQILYRQPNAYFPIIPPRLKSTYDFRTRIF